MNLESINLKELFNENNLRFLDAYNYKIRLIRNSLNEASLEAKNFTSNLSSAFNSNDNPKEKLRELKRQLKDAEEEFDRVIAEAIGDAATTAISFAGPGGTFAAIMMLLIKKSFSSVQIRQNQDVYNPQDNLKEKPIIIEGVTISDPDSDLKNASIDDPRWKSYFESKYNEWLEYAKNNPKVKDAKTAEDFLDPSVFFSILSFFKDVSKKFTVPGIVYDATTTGMDILNAIQKIDDIKAKIEKLEKENSGKGAGNKNNDIEKNFASSISQNNISSNAYIDNGVRPRASQRNVTKENYVPDEEAFQAIFNKKNIAMMKVFDETIQGVGQNIGSFFTGLAQGNPDAFKSFLKSIVNTFITSVQAMIFAAKGAAAAKGITSFGLSLITDLPALAAAWLALEAAKGIIQGLNKGGQVQGFGDTDTVPAMLTPGEYVIKKSVVNKFGSGFFEWINGGGLTNSLAGHYAGGGMVAAGARPMQLELIGDVKISGRGNDLYGIIRKEQFRVRGARS